MISPLVLLRGLFMKKNILLFLLFFSSLISSQTIISGKIVDGKSKSALVGVNIVIISDDIQSGSASC